MGAAPGDAPSATPRRRSPAAGARVVARGEDGSERATRADADGRYRIEGLPPGRYVLNATLLGPARRAGPSPPRRRLRPERSPPSTSLA